MNKGMGLAWSEGRVPQLDARSASLPRAMTTTQQETFHPAQKTDLRDLMKLLCVKSQRPSTPVTNDERRSNCCAPLKRLPRTDVNHQRNRLKRTDPTRSLPRSAEGIEAGAACGARRRGFPQTHARTLDHGLRALRRALVSRVVTIDVADGRRGRESAISFAREYSPVSGTPSRRAGHAK